MKFNANREEIRPSKHNSLEHNYLMPWPHIIYISQALIYCLVPTNVRYILVGILEVEMSHNFLYT